MSNDEKISKKWGWIRALALLGILHGKRELIPEEDKTSPEFQPACWTRRIG
jgi:hypothetical protein